MMAVSRARLWSHNLIRGARRTRAAVAKHGRGLIGAEEVRASALDLFAKECFRWLANGSKRELMYRSTTACR